jgi:hypothetical protein
MSGMKTSCRASEGQSKSRRYTYRAVRERELRQRCESSQAPTGRRQPPRQPSPEGGVTIEFVCTGRLRCSPKAAQFLRDSIDAALKMLAQPEQQMGPTVATGRLN